MRGYIAQYRVVWGLYRVWVSQHPGYIFRGTYNKDSRACESLLGSPPIYEICSDLKTTGAQETTTQLAQVMSRLRSLGAPPVYRMHSDSGREFENAVMQEMQKRYAIFRTESSPYDPQATGRAKRVQSLKIEGVRQLGSHRFVTSLVVPCDFASCFSV